MKKFRLRDTYQNQWASRASFALYMGDVHYVCEDCPDTNEALISEETLDYPRFVLQSSLGEGDMNDKEIFEGDIVSVIEEDCLFEVCFGRVQRRVKVADNVNLYADVDINCFYFRHIKSGNPCFNLYNNRFGEHDLKRTKIVGNIFENPDLLKTK